MNVKRVLFVCTGNSCRSVMAERLMKRLLRDAAIEGVEVASAGAFAIDGMPATREAQTILQEAGIEAAAHRSRRLTREMIEEADLILVMESFHAEHILQEVPSARGKVHLLKSYGLARGETAAGHPGIQDPIGKPLEVYEVCFGEIREAVERVVKSLGAHSV